MVIPYEYAAKFELTGQPGNVVQDVISITADGIFVAVAVGYGFKEERSRPLPIATAPGAPRIPAEITLGQLPPRALIEGFRVNPRSENMVFQGDLTPEQAATRRERELSTQNVPVELLNKTFERMKPVEPISFLFSVVDSGTGRELQDEPVHNLASLGKSNGERPFRLLAQPLSFLPRSTIRMQVIERTPDAVGTLFIVLYGYTVLAGSACPEPVVRSLAEIAAREAKPFGDRSRVIPFDYVAKFPLTGRPGNRLEDEVPITVEGGFVATSLGYGLASESEDVKLVWSRVRPWWQRRGLSVPGPLDQWLAPGPDDQVRAPLGDLPLLVFPRSALIDGIRIRPGYARIAFLSGGGLAEVSRALASEMFERLNRPEDVSFLYLISDTGTGRDWQNQPIHNIAGLGIADGKRPFKKLARPMVFQPRSTIRVRIEEHFGRGTLFLAFQGYKVLGAPPAGARP
jgi:hypothetical protein